MKFAVDPILFIQTVVNLSWLMVVWLILGFQAAEIMGLAVVMAYSMKGASR